MKIIKQSSLLLVCFILLVAGSYQQYKKIWGNDFKTEATATNINAIQTLEDGTQVINTTDLAKDISGYGGRVPLEIYIKNGKILKVKALKNSETPEFFQHASKLLTQWNGNTPEEALRKKVDGVTGATFSSRGILGNMQRGLQYAAKVSARTSALDKADHSPKTIACVLTILMGIILPLFFSFFPPIRIYFIIKKIIAFCNKF